MGRRDGILVGEGEYICSHGRTAARGTTKTGNEEQGNWETERKIKRGREGEGRYDKERGKDEERERGTYVQRVIPWVRREGSGGKRERGQDTKRSNGDVHNARGRASACALARNGATLSAPLGGINRSRALASTRTYDPKNSQLVHAPRTPICLIAPWNRSSRSEMIDHERVRMRHEELPGKIGEVLEQ